MARSDEADKAIAVLESRLRAAFRAQAREFRREIGAVAKSSQAEPPDDDIMPSWLAAWDRVARRTRERIWAPILAGINRAFGIGQDGVVDLANEAITARLPGAMSATTARTAPIAPAPEPEPVTLPMDPTPIDARLSITFRARDPRAAAYINQHAAERVASIEDTTRSALAGIIQQGLRNGDSPGAIANAITDRFESMAVGRPQQHIGSRAHLIATTEVGDAYAGGQLAGAKAMAAKGLQMEKSWLTSGGARCCDVCQGNEAQGWIPISQPFQSGDDRPLGHPGCRCSLQIRVAPAGGKMRKYATLADLPPDVRKRLKPSQQNAYRRAQNRVTKDGPGVSAVHVDTPLGGGAKRRQKKPPTPDGVRLIKSDQAQRYTLGIVYEPLAVDTQDDYATADEIEQACWDFNRRHIGNGQTYADRLAKGALGIQHASWFDSHGEIIESYIAPCDMVIGDEPVTKGTWLMGTIWSPENWAKVQRGELTGLSMGGKARRV